MTFPLQTNFSAGVNGNSTVNPQALATLLNSLATGAQGTSGVGNTSAADSFVPNFSLPGAPGSSAPGGNSGDILSLFLNFILTLFSSFLPGGLPGIVDPATEGGQGTEGGEGTGGPEGGEGTETPGGPEAGGGAEGEEEIPPAQTPEEEAAADEEAAAEPPADTPVDNKKQIRDIQEALKSFKKFDKNNNGVLSRAELRDVDNKTVDEIANLNKVLKHLNIDPKKNGKGISKQDLQQIIRKLKAGKSLDQIATDLKAELPKKVKADKKDDKKADNKKEDKKADNKKDDKKADNKKADNKKDDKKPKKK